MEFNTITVDILTPGIFIEFDNSRAFRGLLGRRHKALIIAQRLSTGTVAEGVPVRISSVGVAQQAFGRSSMIAAMCEAFLAQAPYVELWAVALDDDGDGVAAAGTITFTGPATAAGTLNLYVAGKRVKVGVASGDTADDLATATAAAINADASLPITAAVDGVTTSQVNTTSRHKGEVGNGIDVRANYYQGDKLPAGVGITIVCPTDGTTNPDLATAIAAIGDEQYLTICTPYIDAANLTAIEAELSTRWEGMSANDGHCFSSVPGTHSDGSTLGDSRNNPHVTIMGAQSTPIWTPILAARVGAADAAESHPARPRRNLVLEGVLPPSVGDRYTRAERNLHLLDGIATYTVDDGGLCRIERLVTTYNLNSESVEDYSYLDVEILRSLSYIRYQARARLAQVYPRHMLADDGGDFDPTLPIATPSGIKGELAALGKDLERAGIIESAAQWTADLIVQRREDNRNAVDIRLSPDLVNQLLNINSQIQYRV